MNRRISEIGYINIFLCPYEIKPAFPINTPYKLRSSYPIYMLYRYCLEETWAMRSTSTSNSHRSCSSTLLAWTTGKRSCNPFPESVNFVSQWGSALSDDRLCPIFCFNERRNSSSTTKNRRPPFTSNDSLFSCSSDIVGSADSAAWVQETTEETSSANGCSWGSLSSRRPS